MAGYVEEAWGGGSLKKQVQKEKQKPNPFFLSKTPQSPGNTRPLCVKCHWCWVTRLDIGTSDLLARILTEDLIDPYTTGSQTHCTAAWLVTEDVGSSPILMAPVDWLGFSGMDQGNEACSERVQSLLSYWNEP